MLHAKSLPQRLWDESLNCATYIQNRSPHRYVKDKIPYETWSGIKLEVTHFPLTATEPMPSRHCHLVQSSDPQSYAEAAGHPSWESTMEEEYNSLLENQTWDLVPLPSGRKLVRCKWVYRTKSAADGKITR
jgi:hypothetical protein